MKYNILLLLILFTTTGSVAQHGILINTQNDIISPRIIKLDNQKLLMIKSDIELQYYDSMFNPLGMQYSSNEILIFDVVSKKVDKFVKFINDSLEMRLFHEVFLVDQEIYVFVQNRNLDYSDSFAFEVQVFDLELNHVKTVSLNFENVPKPHKYSYSVMNSNYELLVSVGSERILSFVNHIFKFDLSNDGQIIGSVRLDSNHVPNNLYEINNKTYSYSKYFHDNLLVLDSDFEIDTIIKNLPDQGQGNQFKSMVINNKMALVSHSGHPTERLIFLDTIGVLDTVFEAPIPGNINFNQYIPSFYGIDTIGSTVYFSNNIHISDPICYVFTSQPPCANYFSLHRVDTSGQIYWSNYYGGDYAYLVNNVVATPDSGCLVVFAFNRGLPTDFTHSIRYLKVDKHGNPELNYLKDLSNLVGLEEVVADELPMLKLYPNPASNVLNVEHNIKGIQHLEVYNMQGQLVLQQSSTGFEQSFMIDKLPSGQYVLRLLGKEKVFSYGFVKGE